MNVASLKLTFLALKKVVQVVQIGGGGRGGGARLFGQTPKEQLLFSGNLPLLLVDVDVEMDG